MFFFFFFQAEDGIRDLTVTGVQTCALPILVQLATQGVTIFLTTHYMEEADELCRRVAFLSEGRIVALDTPDNLKMAHGQKSLKATLANGQSLTIALDEEGAGKQLEALVSTGQIRTLHSTEDRKSVV